jgi:hypothetical protein
MNNWMKMGMAGFALAGSLQALATDTPIEDPRSQQSTIQVDEGGFKIEASDLIAKKMRDYVKEEQTKQIV